jgi:thioredoxin reductase (NADPH)
MRSRWECLIVGGGPAGLTAAIYLARYRRRVLLADAANSRAEAIPKSHNHPGFAGGVSGHELLARLRRQARRYEVEIMNVKIEKLEKSNGHFVAKGAGAPLEADRVLLATGITDASPALPGLQRAIANGLLRYCPICDGYEALDKKIAVVGPLQHACKEAAFLRTYSRSVTVLPLDGADGRSASLRGQGIELAPAAPEHFSRVHLACPSDCKMSSGGNLMCSIPRSGASCIRNLRPHWGRAAMSWGISRSIPRNARQSRACMRQVT